MSADEFTEWATAKGLKVDSSIRNMNESALYAYSKQYDKLSNDFPIVTEYHQQIGTPFQIKYTPTSEFTAEGSHGMEFGAFFSKDGFTDIMPSYVDNVMNGFNVKGSAP